MVDGSWDPFYFEKGNPSTCTRDGRIINAIKQDRFKNDRPYVRFIDVPFLGRVSSGRRAARDVEANYVRAPSRQFCNGQACYSCVYARTHARDRR